MKRKIILIGKKTHVISLPTKFVKSNNIQKGQEINLEIDGNQLNLTTENISKEKEISINLENENLIKSSLNLFYSLGIDKLKIICHPLLQTKIKASIEDFFGLEIIKETKNYCVIQSFTFNIPNINNFINQCYYKTQLANTTKKQLKAKEYINLCLRHLSKQQTRQSYNYTRILTTLKHSFHLNQNLLEQLRVLTFKFNLEQALKLRCENLPQEAKDILDVIISLNLN